jgi:HEAT repeat protein
MNSILSAKKRGSAMEWKWVVDLACQCEDLCEQQGRTQARQLAQAHIQIDELRRALRQGSGLVRRKALHLLTFFEWSTVLNDLVSALERDSSPIVRHEAAYFLGVLKCEEAVAPLAEALRCDSSELVRHEAAEALGDLGCRHALDALKQAIEDTSLIVRETAEIAIDQLYDDE